MINTVTDVTPTKITETVEGQEVNVTTLFNNAKIRKKAGFVLVYMGINTQRAISADEPIMGGVPSQSTKYLFSGSGGYSLYIDGSQVKTRDAIPSGTAVTGFVAFPE